MADERSHPLLLLHGAGLGGWIWTSTRKHLTGPSQPVDLPGRDRGTHPNDVSLRDCVDHVVTLLMAADEPQVIVAHSFSAQLALLAAGEHPERVRAIVLVGGVLPERGKPLLSIFPQPGRFLLGMYMRIARRGVVLPAGLARTQYGTGLDAATTNMVVERLVPEARGMYLDPVDWRKAPAHIPVIYLKLGSDAAIPPGQQDEMARRAGATRLETLDAGHLPMLSHPGPLAEILNRIARQLA